MRRIARVSRKFALAVAGIAGLSIALLSAASPVRAGKPFVATINGPATVWDDESCTWTASTDITYPQYEWTAVNGSSTTFIGDGPWVTYAFDKSAGTHQGLHLRVFNSSGDEAFDANLIGIYFYGVGNPDCP